MNSTETNERKPRLIITSDNQPPASGATLVPFKFKGEILVDSKPKIVSGDFNVPVEESKCTRRTLDLLWVFLTEACGYKVTFLTCSPAVAPAVGQLGGKEAL
jgi:hypothetical protein